MSAIYDAEEADQEAAERLRVAEWAAEHQNPLAAALQRAETAEKRARDAENALARCGVIDQPALSALRRDGGER